MSVQIKRTDTQIIVIADYNKEFVRQAHNLAGKFNAYDKSWGFDLRDEADVLEACYLCYGDDGYRYSLCDVQISLPNGYYVDKDTINFFGRPVARAFGRDSGAKVFDGVKIKEGGFQSGGSAKHWVTCAEKGTVIVLRDVALPLVEQMQYDDVVVEIINRDVRQPTPQNLDKATLIAEKAELLARLVEINAVLGD